MHFCEICGDLVEMDSMDPNICISCQENDGYDYYEELDFYEKPHTLNDDEVDIPWDEEEEDGN